MVMRTGHNLNDLVAITVAKERPGFSFALDPPFVVPDLVSAVRFRPTSSLLRRSFRVRRSDYGGVDWWRGDSCGLPMWPVSDP